MIVPVNKKCFKLTRALKGRNASTPGGLSKSGIIPVSRLETKKIKFQTNIDYDYTKQDL